MERITNKEVALVFRTFIWSVYAIFRTIFTAFSLIIVNILEAMGRTEQLEARIDKTARTWAKRLVAASGSKVQVSGAEFIPTDRSVLFVANHQSNFDIALLLGYVPRAKGFIAKIELANIPIVSAWMKKMHSLFLDRGNLRKSLLTMREAVEILKQGHSLVIFPEGTRSKSNTLAEFKKGSLSIAEKANVPVVPVTIIDTYKILEGNQGFRIKPTPVKLIIAKPIYPGELEKGQDFAGMVKDIIQTNMMRETR